MKKIYITIISLLVVAAAVFSAFYVTSKNNNQETITKKTLTVGLEGTYAPFSYRQDGNLTGFEVELAKAVANEMNYKIKFEQTKWDSLIAGLDAKRYDVVFNNISKSSEREKSYSFGDAYLYSHTVLIQAQNSNLNKLADIKAKRFAQSPSSNYGQTAKKAGAEIVSVPGFSEAISLISSNRADGTLNDLSAFTIWESENNNTGIKAVSMDDEIEPVAAYPLFTKNNTKLRDKVNVALEKLRDNGVIKELSEKFFKTDLTEK